MIYENEPWDAGYYIKVVKTRPLRVEEIPLCGYVSYHNIIKSEEQEQTNGEYIVDYIVERASFPNGRWTIPQGVDANVRDE